MKEKTVVKHQNRITELDLFRGIAVLLMIFDHIMFDLWGLFPSVFIDYPPSDGVGRFLYELSYKYWFWDVREIVRTVIVFVFLALTGVCCSFSRSNTKRGLRLGALSLAMSAVTFAVGFIIGDLDIGITFGVLHCIAVMLLIVGLLEKLNIDKLLYLSIGILMLALGIILQRNEIYVSYYNTPFFTVIWKTVIGTATSGGDSFSIFFHGGQIMIGVFLGKWLYSEKKSLLFKKYYSNIITFIGRHSLAVYLIHQIVIPIVGVLIMLACGFEFSLIVPFLD